MKYHLLSFFIFAISPSLIAQIGFEENIISDSLFGAREVYAFDLNGDLNKDIIAVSRLDDKVVWYQNLDGEGSFGPEQIISAETDYPISISVVDVDGDDDLDIVSAAFFGDQLAWHENLDGLGTFAAPQIISTEINGPFSIYTADLDNDGDADVLAGAQVDDKITWYENTNGQGSFGPEQTIFNGGFYAAASDIDGDGDIDIIAVTTDTTDLAWFENTDGEGSFGPPNIISENTGTPQTIYAYDLDGDGDKDILSATDDFFGTEKIVWYQNLDGQGNFGSEEIISTNVMLPFGLFAADLDADGDLDVFSTSFNSDELAWYENIDGAGSFSEEKIISNTVDGVESIFVTDLDADGDLDVLSASANDHKIVWHENIGMVPNLIEGKVSFDILSNGCTQDSLSSANIMIITEGNGFSFARFTDQDGAYRFNMPAGEFITEIASSLPNYYASNPNQYTAVFTDSGDTTFADFCIQPTMTVNDLNISVYPTSVARPGELAAYRLVYKNNGTTQLSGNIVLEFDQSILNFTAATTTLIDQSVNSLTFAFNDLNPLETQEIGVFFEVSQNALMGSLEFIATINSMVNDQNFEDNIFILNQTIVNSFDPNDIRVLEGETITVDEVNNFLHYIVRFQNTGTAEAINIKITNVLDEKLDWQTMQLGSSSHENRVEISENQEVAFFFEDIFLPDSTTNEPESHGFVAYKIKPKEGVALGDIISNQANIFFDFNPPVATNIVWTEVVEPTATEPINFPNFSIYPVPTSGFLKIKSSTEIEKIVITDTLGHHILTINNADSLDISHVDKGIYFCQILDVYHHRKTVKIIKY